MFGFSFENITIIKRTTEGTLGKDFDRILSFKHDENVCQNTTYLGRKLANAARCLSAIASCKRNAVAKLSLLEQASWKSMKTCIGIVTYTTLVS